jgi:hypothetical protein
MLDTELTHKIIAPPSKSIVNLVQAYSNPPMKNA